MNSGTATVQPSSTVALQYLAAEQTLCTCIAREGWDAQKWLGDKPIVVRGTWYGLLYPPYTYFKIAI